MMKRILSKASWKDAIGATKKPKRLKLLSHNGLFICPVAYPESEPIEVNVVVVNMFPRNTVDITTLKKTRHCQSFS